MAGALVSPLISAPKLELPLRGLPILDSLSVAVAESKSFVWLCLAACSLQSSRVLKKEPWHIEIRKFCSELTFNLTHTTAALTLPPCERGVRRLPTGDRWLSAG